LTCDCRLFCKSRHKLLNCDAWTYDISTHVHSTWCVRTIANIVTIQINLARISQGASIKCHLDIKHRTLTGIDFNDTQLDTLSIVSLMWEPIKYPLDIKHRTLMGINFNAIPLDTLTIVPLMWERIVVKFILIEPLMI